MDLTHNVTLLHHDVMDRDEHRPTAWKVFGATDARHALAFQFADSRPTERLYRS
ncbi:hypothetical protein ACWF94_11035 [Streptomyces sp. NPDC055078]